MPKDIRKIVKNYSDEKVELSANHQSKFQRKLYAELHPKKRNYRWLYAVASIVLLIGLGIQLYPTNEPQHPTKTKVEQLSLGTISPELKTVEAYYTNSINLALSQIELTEESKEVFDGYIIKLGELTNEYKSLTDELNKGVNDNVINAMISNLQLRLQLLQRLQQQLNELKKTTQNETQTI